MIAPSSSSERYDCATSFSVTDDFMNWPSPTATPVHTICVQVNQTSKAERGSISAEVLRMATHETGWPEGGRTVIRIPPYPTRRWPCGRCRETDLCQVAAISGRLCRLGTR